MTIADLVVKQQYYAPPTKDEIQKLVGAIAQHHAHAPVASPTAPLPHSTPALFEGSCDHKVSASYDICRECKQCAGCCIEHYYCHACSGTYFNAQHDKCAECLKCGSCCSCNSMSGGEDYHGSDCGCGDCDSSRADLLVNKVIPWVERGITVTKRSIDWDRAIFRTMDPINAMCDFYLLQYLICPPTFAREDLWLEDTTAWRVYADQARVMLNQFIETIDPIFVQCLDLAVGGEIRHHQLLKSSRLLDSEREPAWSDWLGIRDQVGIDAVKDAAELFRDGSMRRGYGGENWAVIADILYLRLSGVLSPEMFVDRVFTIQHNGGSVMDKVRWGHNNRNLMAGPSGCIEIGKAHADTNPDLGVLAFGASDEVRSLMRAMWPARNRLLRNQRLEMMLRPTWKIADRANGDSSGSRGRTFSVLNRDGTPILDGKRPAEATSTPTKGYAWECDITEKMKADQMFDDHRINMCGSVHGAQGVGARPTGYGYCTLPAHHEGVHVRMHWDHYTEQYMVQETWSNIAKCWMSSNDVMIADRAPAPGDWVWTDMTEKTTYSEPKCTEKNGDDQRCMLLKHDEAFPHCRMDKKIGDWRRIKMMWVNGGEAQYADALPEVEDEDEGELRMKVDPYATGGVIFPKPYKPQTMTVDPKLYANFTSLFNKHFTASKESHGSNQ